MPVGRLPGTHEGRISVWKRSCARHGRALQGNRARLTMRSWRRQQRRLDARRQRASTPLPRLISTERPSRAIRPYCSCAICAAMICCASAFWRRWARGALPTSCVFRKARHGFAARCSPRSRAALKSRSTNTSVISTTRLSLVRSVFALRRVRP